VNDHSVVKHLLEVTWGLHDRGHVCDLEYLQVYDVALIVIT
jgi:hypothetical protein